MTDRLPYTLTKGVTATREGLVWDGNIANSAVDGALLTMPGQSRVDGRFIIRWPDAAERLRYRKGEPWCTETLAGSIICPRRRADTDVEHALHRLAAILCDDAEGFRVLHWCVTELGGRG